LSGDTNQQPYPHSTAELVARRQDAEGLYELIFEGWRVAEHAQPGQFANFQLPRHGSDPLLRRPMSIAFVTGERFGLLVQAVGVGSRILAEAPLGEVVDVIGPVGTTFPPPEEGSRVALVGGGVGVAPLRFLFEHHVRSAEWEILVGARTESLLPFQQYFQGTGRARFSTDDGSLGLHGNVVQLLSERHALEAFDRIYTCGPPRMIEAVARFAAERGISCWVSLEARMACAMGQCLGCVVPTIPEGYARVCTEGPCFDAASVRLDVDLGWSGGR
jgi:dihydroorotate dehydrogenase electron transfer subunit